MKVIDDIKKAVTKGADRAERRFKDFGAGVALAGLGAIAFNGLNDSHSKEIDCKPTIQKQEKPILAPPSAYFDGLEKNYQHSKHKARDHGMDY